MTPFRCESQGAFRAVSASMPLTFSPRVSTMARTRRFRSSCYRIRCAGRGHRMIEGTTLLQATFMRSQRSENNSWVSYFTNGWQIGGITQFRSGLAYGLFGQTGDPALDGRAIGNRGNPYQVAPFVKFYPRNFQTIVVHGVARSVNFFFDPRSFRNVVITHYTQALPRNLGRNVYSVPLINLWSASFIKRGLRFTEGQHIEFRADIDNLFNHANFATPNILTLRSVTFLSRKTDAMCSCR